MDTEDRITVGILGIDYKTPIEVREKLNFHTTEIDFVVASLKAEEVFLESFFLCTCNRTLLVYLCLEKESSRASQVAVSLFNRWADHSIRAEYLVSEVGEDALNKLLRIALGADSAILGEDQILGQISIFYEVALSNGLTGPILNRIFQNLFFAARKIKMTFPISEGRVSTPGIVTEEISTNSFLEKNFPVNVLVVGWGDITRVVCKILNSDESIYKISVANRTWSKITDPLVNKIEISDIKTIAKNFDVIISMTSRMGHVIELSNLRESKRRHLIFDLGVPRNIDPTITTLSHVQLFNIDDITKKSKIRIKKRSATVASLIKTRDFLFFQRKMIKFINTYHILKKKYEIIEQKMGELSNKRDLNKNSKKTRKLLSSLNKATYREVFNC